MSKKNNINNLGEYVIVIKKPKANLVYCVLFLFSAFYTEYLYKIGIVWTKIGDSRSVTTKVALAGIFTSLFFLHRYFKTPKLLTYKNGMKINNDEILYKNIKNIEIDKKKGIKVIITTKKNETFKYITNIKTKKLIEFFDQIYMKYSK